MRIVIVGATPESVMTVRHLVERGHEVVVIERNGDAIDALSQELDCSFLHGDGTHPQILREANPESTDALFCLTDHDQSNILASLVGRSVGFERVITSVQDPGFEEICGAIGIEDPVVPARTIGRYLGDLAEGLDVLELRTLVKGEARYFSMTAGKDETGKVEALDLPEKARVVCLYRGDDFILADPDTRIHEGDDVVILTHRKHVSELKERWDPKVADSETE
jgi:trk system potassium uptake protein TrkA